MASETRSTLGVTPPIERPIERVRILYQKAFKVNGADAWRTCFAVSTAQLFTYGRDRLLAAGRRVRDGFTRLSGSGFPGMTAGGADKKRPPDGGLTEGWTGLRLGHGRKRRKPSAQAEPTPT